MIRALICAILLTCSQAQAAWSASHENGNCLTISWFHSELTKRYQSDAQDLLKELKKRSDRSSI